jgi:hypothetical protein
MKLDVFVSRTVTASIWPLTPKRTRISFFIRLNSRRTRLEYLILLSICEILRLRNASFPKFLTSGATNIDKCLETNTNRSAWQYIKHDVYDEYGMEVWKRRILS